VKDNKTKSWNQY